MQSRIYNAMRGMVRADPHMHGMISYNLPQNAHRQDWTRFA